MYAPKRWGVTGVRKRQSTKQAMTVEKLSENVGGVMHNLKSALMAVNGYIDLLASDHTDKIYQQAKHSVGVMETIINNLVFAMRAYRNTEPAELSLNACVRSTVELLRTNRTFCGKVKFELELGEDDGIYDVPAKVMGRLDAFITDAAMRALADGDYALTVVTVCEGKQVSARVGDDEIVFPRGDV